VIWFLSSFLSPSSASKKLLPSVIFSVSSWRTTSYHSLIATYSEKNLFQDFGSQPRCLLHGSVFTWLITTTKELPNYTASQPVGLSTLNCNASFRVEVVTWSIASSFYMTHTKRMNKMRMYSRKDIPAAFKKPDFQSHPYAFFFSKPHASLIKSVP
jgi:hypothetical protein